MTIERKTPLRARKRAKTGSNPSLARRDVLVCLPETDAILAINAGAILAPSARIVGLGTREIACWTGTVPRSVIRRVESESKIGQAFILRVSEGNDTVESNRPLDRLALPISMSRVRGVLLESAEYLSLVRARLANFPDAALHTVNLVVEPAAFGAESVEGDLFGVEKGSASDPEEVQTAIRGDRTGGAVAGLLTAFEATRGLSDAAVASVWKAIATTGAPLEADAELILRLGGALSVEKPDSVSNALIRAAVLRFRGLSTRTGFDPNELLAMLVSDVTEQLGEPERDTLRRFVEVASPVLKLQAGANREILQDGGSVMMRGLLAFLRTPSLEKLEGVASRGGRLGPRVGAFAMTLAGFFEGTTAMPSRLKAEPRDRLLALGDLIEAFGVPDRPVVVGSSVRAVTGKLEWVASLMGYEVFRRELAVAPSLKVLVSAASDERWGIAVADGELEFQPMSALASHSVRVAAATASPCAPDSAVVRLSVALVAPKKLAQLEAAIHCATEHRLVVRLTEDTDKRMLLDAYLSTAYTLGDVGGAVRRLNDAVASIAEAAKAGSKAKIPVEQNNTVTDEETSLS